MFGQVVSQLAWWSLGLRSFLAISAEVRAKPASTLRPASWLLCFRLHMRSSIVRSTSLWIISSLVKSSLLPSRPGKFALLNSIDPFQHIQTSLNTEADIYQAHICAQRRLLMSLDLT